MTPRLARGETVAFPTETVYGLGAPIFSPEAIKKIFAVKGRPQDNPLIAHISDLSQADLLGEALPETFFTLASTFFPGPLTLVVKKHPSAPSIVSAGLPTIAIRMPIDPIALKLIQTVGEPLVAPSANLSGTPSSTTYRHVLSDFDGLIAGVVNGGDCVYGIESTVLDLVSFERPTLLRPGSISKEELEEVLGSPVDTYSSGPKSSPGMKYRHYAPSIPVYFFKSKADLDAHLALKKRSYLISPQASTLYAHLRFAEKMGYDEVVIFSTEKLDPSLENRLEKILYANSCH